MIWRRQEWWGIWVAPSRPAGLLVRLEPGPGGGGREGQGAREPKVLNALLWTLDLTLWAKRRRHSVWGGIAWGQDEGRLECERAEVRGLPWGRNSQTSASWKKTLNRYSVVWPLGWAVGRHQKQSTLTHTKLPNCKQNTHGSREILTSEAKQRKTGLFNL